MCPPVGAIHELPLQRRRDPLVGSVFSEARACHVRSTRIDDPLPLPRARRACPSDFSENLSWRSMLRRDLLVRSAVQRWIIHCLSPGLKSRVESGAKAPHSIWSAAIHRRFLVKGLAFTAVALIRMETEHRSGWNLMLHRLQWTADFQVGRRPEWNRGADRSGTRPVNPCNEKCVYSVHSWLTHSWRVPLPRAASWRTIKRLWPALRRLNKGNSPALGRRGVFARVLQSSWGLVFRLTRK